MQAVRTMNCDTDIEYLPYEHKRGFPPAFAFWRPSCIRIVVQQMAITIEVHIRRCVPGRSRVVIDTYLSTTAKIQVHLEGSAC